MNAIVKIRTTGVRLSPQMQEGQRFHTEWRIFLRGLKDRLNTVNQCRHAWGLPTVLHPSQRRLITISKWYAHAEAIRYAEQTADINGISQHERKVMVMYFAWTN